MNEPDAERTFSFSPWGPPQPPAKMVIDISGEKGENEMSECKDGESCQFSKVMEMEFALLAQESRSSSGRRTAVNDYISEKVQINHMEEGTKVGTREAAAMQRMDQDKSANKSMEMTTALAAANAAGK